MATVPQRGERWREDFAGCGSGERRLAAGVDLFSSNSSSRCCSTFLQRALKSEPCPALLAVCSVAAQSGRFPVGDGGRFRFLPFLSSSLFPGCAGSVFQSAFACTPRSCPRIATPPKRKDKCPMAKEPEHHGSQQHAAQRNDKPVNNGFVRQEAGRSPIIGVSLESGFFLFPNFPQIRQTKNPHKQEEQIQNGDAVINGLLLACRDTSSLGNASSMRKKTAKCSRNVWPTRLVNLQCRSPISCFQRISKGNVSHISLTGWVCGNTTCFHVLPWLHFRPLWNITA